MPRIFETLPPVGRLQMALRMMTPTRLAQTFAAFAGQFYDHSDLFEGPAYRWVPWRGDA